MVFIKSYVSGDTYSLNCDVFPSLEHLKNAIIEKVPISDDGSDLELKLFYNGKCIQDGHLEFSKHGTIHAMLGVLGGKGGFGSMLRAIGAQIEKTTNYEACRDLSGRRLRDIKEEKRLKKWLEKQSSEKREKEKRRLEKLERLSKGPKHDFVDPEYDKQRSELTENIHDSVSQGFQATTSSSQVKCEVVGGKRKTTAPPENKVTKKSKHNLWIGVEGGSDDSDDSSSESIDSSDQPGVQEHHDLCGDCSSSGSSSSTKDSSNVKTDGPLLESTSKQASEDHNIGKSSSAISHEVPQIKTGTKDVKLDEVKTDSLDYDLRSFRTASEMETLGLEVLKNELASRGLKCGGTLQERAKRLFSVIGLDLDQIDPQLFANAKPKKK